MIEGVARSAAVPPFEFALLRSGKGVLGISHPEIVQIQDPLVDRGKHEGSLAARGVEHRHMGELSGTEDRIRHDGDGQGVWAPVHIHAHSGHFHPG